jgi:hypothetical protein
MTETRQLSRRTALAVTLGAAGAAATAPISAAAGGSPAAGAAVGEEETTDALRVDPLPTAVRPGRLRLSGSFRQAYDLQLIVDGAALVPAEVIETDGVESGRWQCVLDTSDLAGEIELMLRGSDSVTRYGVFSAPATVLVDNPRRQSPAVSIASPVDGSRIDGPIDIVVTVQANQRLVRVEVRISGERWRPAERVGDRHIVRWDPAFDAGFASVEARAVDGRGNVGVSATSYVAVGSAEAARPTPVWQGRAMWVWENESYNLVFNPGSRRVLESFVGDTATYAGARPVKTLYLGVGRYADGDMLNDSRPQVQEFLAWAHGRGLAVHATVAGGTQPAYFGVRPRYQRRAVAEMEKVLNYCLASPVEARFDGVNIDIEPYSLPDFTPDKPAPQQRWLDVLALLSSRRDRSGLPLLIGPAIPRWTDTSASCTDIPWRGEVKNLNEHLQDISDYIAIMDYRDTADGSAGIIDQARTEIAYAEQIGKANSVVLGVETKDVADGGDPYVISFYHKGRQAMEDALAATRQAFGSSPAFGGVALHHYETLRDLPGGWGGEEVLPPTPDDVAPPARTTRVQMDQLGYDRVRLSWERSLDDTEASYLVYRDTIGRVPLDPAHCVGGTHGLSFVDVGLRGDDRYFYRVVPIDTAGRRGAASALAVVGTPAAPLQPIRLVDLGVELVDGRAHFSARVVDADTGRGVAATVFGRFTYVDGTYVSMAAGADGTITASSKMLGGEHGRVGFRVDRVAFAGRYWVHSEDSAADVSLTW